MCHRVEFSLVLTANVLDLQFVSEAICSAKRIQELASQDSE
jgi:hypothetical protein